MNIGNSVGMQCNRIVLDAHCDTITAMLNEKRRLGELSGIGHLDLPRMQAGGINVQFFAAFIAPEHKDKALRRALSLINFYFQEIEENKGKIIHVNNMVEIRNAIISGKVASLLFVEGGEALEGSIDVLHVFYRLGVRGITLTWNGSNELGCGVGSDGKGLTPFGFSVVREMNRLGMLVDVSHLSEQGFWDVINVSRGPFIASHSNCRALCEHPRNLTNQQIQELAKKGGVVGITFVPDFLGGERPSLNEVLDHICQAVSIGGYGCVGLGSDFDGTAKLPLGLEDCSRMPALISGLLDRGFSDDVISNILGGNFLRVIGQVLK